MPHENDAYILQNARDAWRANRSYSSVGSLTMARKCEAAILDILAINPKEVSHGGRGAEHVLPNIDFWDRELKRVRHYIATKNIGPGVGYVRTDCGL